MKKRVTGILIAVALLTIAAAGIGPASAYFTDRDEGSQSHAVQLGDSTTVQENIVDWNKQVTITNDASSTEAVWVRAQAIAGSSIQDLLKIDGSNWSGTKGDWYYYASPVDPGQAASVLNVQIPSTSLPEAEEGATFNVIIVYETTPDTGNAGNAQQAFAEAQNVQSSQTGGN